MADKKISALNSATTPLGGTEVLPIVQGGSTVKVAVSNLTAGRDISTTGITVSSNTGNIELNWASGSTHKVGSTFSTSYFTGMRVDADSRNTDIVSFDASGSGNVRLRTGVIETTRLNVDPTGNVTVNTGNLIVGTAGKGITTGGATALGFGVNNAVDAMTIDTSKNVGVGTTTPTSGSMSNSAIVNAGVFSTLRGSVASTSGVATTIATANQNHALATYIVSCGVSSGAPTAYSAVSIVSADNNVLRITNLQTATNMTISISGTDIQATQTSGGAANILFAVTRIA